MRRRNVASIAWTAIILAITLAPWSAARAETTAEEHYRAALSAAVDASGAFATGSTVLLQIRDHGTGVTVSMTVNADGSLLWSQFAPSSDYVLKCVRVDRCWALSRVDYGDSRWHRLPAGSVAYEQTRAFWADWTSFPWPEGAVHDVSPAAEGGTAYTVVGSGADPVLVETTVVAGASVADTLFMVGADGILVPVRSMLMRAQAEHVPVSAPARHRVGRALTEPSTWRAVINS